MSVFSDLVAGVVTIDAVPPAVGNQRALSSDLDAARDRLDADYPSGYMARNEVQSIAQDANIDGGTFTLTITLYDGTTFTTAAIAFGANAATIQTAIDSASPASVGNGDIVVTGGNIATAPVVLTFSGATVAGQNVATTVIGNSLTDGGAPVTTPVVTVTTDGQSARTALAALRLLGVLGSTPPVQGTATGVTVGTTRATNPYYPTQALIRRLANEAAIADRVPTLEAAILTVAGLSLDGR